MSEIKKNIETCRGEDVLAEVSALPQDPHFGSLVNEAFDPMQQQALHQAGYDGYSEVIEQHKPYTFASAIIQMKSNLLLLLRLLWQYPFGTGTLRSLSDMWQHYITRLSGNETYGIPSRLSSLTDLPSAPLLLADRKISGAVVPDGMSLVHTLAARTEVTELTDDNYGWTLNYNPISYFANLVKWQMCCKDVRVTIPTLNTQMFQSNKVTEIDFPDLEDMFNTTTDGYGTAYSGWFNLSALTKVNLPKLKTITGTLFWGGTAPEEINLPSLTSAGRGIAQSTSGVKRIICPELTTCPGYSYNPNLIAGCADLEYAYFPKLASCTMYGTTGAGGTLQNLPKLEHLVLGKCNIVTANSWNTVCFSNCPKLILLDIRGDLNQSLYLNSWSPDLTDSDVLALFLQNFRTYIALRLTDNGSGKTLTLSQAVYDAIKDESHLFVFDEGTMTIYAYLTNIKHWTVTK